MRESLDEIMARHDALTACGCNCCDDDFCAYVERQKRQKSAESPVANETLPHSAASQRRSLRYVFESMLNRATDMR